MTDEEEIVDNVKSLLQADSRTVERQVNANTTKPKILPVTYFTMLNMGEVYETVMRERKVSTPPLPTPLGSIWFGRVVYQHDQKRPARRSIKDPVWYIDIVTSNRVLETAKRECWQFANDIRDVLENKNLKFKASNCHVADIDPIGFLKREKLPYEYFYRLHLIAKTQ